MSYLNNAYAVFNHEGDKVAVITINHQQGEKDVSIIVTTVDGASVEGKTVLSEACMSVIIYQVRDALCDALVCVGYSKNYLENVYCKYDNDIYDFEHSKVVNVCCDMLIVKQ